MKLTNLTTALFILSTTACGAVVAPDDPTGDLAGNPEGAFDEPPVDGDAGEAPMVTPPALVIEAPRAASTPGSLFAMTFDSGAPIEDVVAQEARGRIDVVEQTITTVRDEEIHLVVELAPPTGTYSRTLVSDVMTNNAPHTDYVLCEQHNVETFDPRCESTRPAPREQPTTGAITTSKWNVTVLDEVTGIPLGSCIGSGVNKVTCSLPARAAARYRIIASAHGFANLWDGSSGFGPFTIGGVGFVGGYSALSEWQCWDWASTPNAFYCANRYEFTRFTAIDRARLDFDPITIRITANGSTLAMATPALIWDAGNDDVPGTAY